MLDIWSLSPLDFGIFTWQYDLSILFSGNYSWASRSRLYGFQNDYLFPLFAESIRSTVLPMNKSYCGEMIIEADIVSADDDIDPFYAIGLNNTVFLLSLFDEIHYDLAREIYICNQTLLIVYYDYNCEDLDDTSTSNCDGLYHSGFSYTTDSNYSDEYVDNANVSIITIDIDFDAYIKIENITDVINIFDTYENDVNSSYFNKYIVNDGCYYIGWVLSLV